MSDPVQDPQPGSKALPFPLPEWLQAGVDRLGSGWARLQAWRTPTVDRWLAAAVISASLLFLGTLLVQQWSEVAPYLQDMQMGLLLAALGATFGALILGGFLWYFVQNALGIGLGWQASLAVHFSSGITKYLPGYGWQYMAKAYLSKRNGSKGKQIGLAMLTEFGILIMTGLILSGMVAGYSGQGWQPTQSIPAWVWYGGTLLAGAAGLIWALMLPRLGGSQQKEMSQGRLIFGVAMGLAGWCLQAVAVWLAARALFPVPWQAYPQMLFALVFSGVVSILVIVVPGGIGVREMTLTLLLAGVLPLSLGGVVAVLVRLTLVVAEVAIFGLIVLGQQLGWGSLGLEDNEPQPAARQD